MDKRYDLYFAGEILPDADLAAVKTNLAQLFKADSAKIEALFSGKPVALKRNLDTASAKKYQQALTRAGAKVIINAAEAVAVSGAAQAPMTTPVEPEKTPEQIRAERLAAQNERRKARMAERQDTPPETPSKTQSKPQSLAERLALQEAEIEAQKQKTLETQQLESRPSDGQFELSPAGADLLDEGDKPVVEAVAVDTSGISLDTAGGDLLHDDEKQPFVPAEVNTANLDVSELGSDLLDATERQPEAIAPVDVPEISVAEAEGDLLADAEKRVFEILDVDTSAMSLAPAGSDMGELKKSLPEVKPDISKLSLAP